MKKILMLGLGRNVKGGMTTVVNSYFNYGFGRCIKFEYISTMEDGRKIYKFWVAIRALFLFLCKISNYDIVHIHMASNASFYRKSVFIILSRLFRKKTIIHQHSCDFDVFFLNKSKILKQKIIRKIFSMADKVIVLSEEWAEFFGNHVCEARKIEIIYNGVVIPEYEKSDYSDRNVLMLGRLGQRKGTYDLLKAIPEVVLAIPDVVFYLGGDGDVEQCKKIVEEQGLGDHVKVLGWVQDKDKKEYLQKCSTFILPSYNEGMPMAVLEAMSYGLATISTNTGGIPQIIEQAKNGIRIDAGNVDAIVNSLVEVLGNMEKRKAMGTAGKERIREKFDLRINLEKLKNIYLSI